MRNLQAAAFGDIFLSKKYSQLIEYHNYLNVFT